MEGGRDEGARLGVGKILLVAGWRMDGGDKPEIPKETGEGLGWSSRWGTGAAPPGTEACGRGLGSLEGSSLGWAAPLGSSSSSPLS